jgi:hypothetical protein
MIKPVTVRVECRPRHGGEGVSRAFLVGDRGTEVVEALDCWPGRGGMTKCADQSAIHLTPQNSRLTRCRTLRLRSATTVGLVNASGAREKVGSRSHRLA